MGAGGGGGDGRSSQACWPYAKQQSLGHPYHANSASAGQLLHCIHQLEGHQSSALPPLSALGGDAGSGWGQDDNPHTREQQQQQDQRLQELQKHLLDMQASMQRGRTEEKEGWAGVTVSTEVQAAAAAAQAEALALLGGLDLGAHPHVIPQQQQQQGQQSAAHELSNAPDVEGAGLGSSVPTASAPGSSRDLQYAQLLSVVLDSLQVLRQFGNVGGPPAPSPIDPTQRGWSAAGLDLDRETAFAGMAAAAGNLSSAAPHERLDEHPSDAQQHQMMLDLVAALGGEGGAASAAPDDWAATTAAGVEQEEDPLTALLAALSAAAPPTAANVSMPARRASSGYTPCQQWEVCVCVLCVCVCCACCGLQKRFVYYKKSKFARSELAQT